MISENVREAYHRDGIVCLREVFDENRITALDNALEEVFAAPGDLAYIERDSTGATTYVSDQFVWVGNPAVREFVFESPAAQIAAELLDATYVNVFYDHAFLRPFGSARRTEWHNDKSYWPIKGDQLCTMWIPTRVTTRETGGLEYLKGSHAWGQMFKDHFFHINREANIETLSAEGAFLNPVPDVEGHRSAFDIVSFVLQPGDCLVHHPLVLHASPAASQPSRRFAYSINWAGEDAIYAPRIDTQRLLFDPGILPGEPLDCDLFPRVWSRG